MEVTTEKTPDECDEALERYKRKTTSILSKFITISINKYPQKSFAVSWLYSFILGIFFDVSTDNNSPEISIALGLKTKAEGRCVFNKMKKMLNTLRPSTFYTALAIFAHDLKFTSSFKSYSNSMPGTAEPININTRLQLTTANRINQLIEDESGGQISDVVTSLNLPDEGIGYAGGNYFSAPWMYGFQLTKEEKFYVASSVKVKVNYMTNKAPLRYFKNHEAEFLEIPFEGGECSLIAALPEHKYEHAKLASILANTGVFNSIIESLEEKYVHVELPIIKVTANLNMLDYFKKAGVATTILEKNTKNAIEGNQDAALEYAYQKDSLVTTIDGGPVPPKKKGLDHEHFKAKYPFLFYIMCSDIVFMSGAVVNPADSNITM